MARTGLARYIKTEALQDMLYKPKAPAPTHENNMETLNKVFN